MAPFGAPRVIAGGILGAANGFPHALGSGGRRHPLKMNQLASLMPHDHRIRFAEVSPEVFFEVPLIRGHMHGWGPRIEHTPPAGFGGMGVGNGANGLRPN